MNNLSSHISQEALREASAWMARLKDAQLSEVERTEFVEWLKRSPVHVRHYLELTSLDVELDDGALYEGLAVGEIPVESQRNLLRWREGRKEAFEGLARRSTRSSLKHFAIAASVVAIAFAVLLTLRGGLFEQDRYRSALGELRSITLPDGSLVTLNTQSDIRVDYSNTTRTVELLRGEALFRVAKRSARPFKVVVGDSVVQAVGTEFNIDRRAEGALVTVVEGRVLVSERQKKGVMLSAGEQVATASGSRIRRLPPPEITRVVTWTQRRLVFDRATVREVVAQLNRYNRMQISVVDAQLARRSVTGTFESGDPESFVQFLEQQGGVSITTREDGALELSGPVGGNSQPSSRL